MLMTTAVITFCAFAAASAARPSYGRRDSNMAPRAVPSAGGAACFFSCPAVGPYGAGIRGMNHDAEGDFGPGAVTCRYDPFDYCIYLPDGSFAYGSASGCVDQATPVGCTSDGSNPSPNTNFRKRSLPRGKTRLERKLADRQYHPKGKAVAKRAVSAANNEAKRVEQEVRKRSLSKNELEGEERLAVRPWTTTANKFDRAMTPKEGVVVARTVKTHVAARSYPSGAHTCYYSCPPSNGLGSYATKIDLTGPDGNPACYCVYDQGYCLYSSEGSLEAGAGSGCPQQAPFAGCTTTGSPDQTTNFRKRTLSRGKTEVEERLATRQYRARNSVS